MTINEAYNKGLDDAENRVIEQFNKIINGESVDAFANPKLEELKNRLINVIGDDMDCQIVENDDVLSCQFLKDLLLNNPTFPTYKKTELKGRVIDALLELMEFIYTRAERRNNGSKNYLKMIENINNHLLTE